MNPDRFGLAQKYGVDETLALAAADDEDDDYDGDWDDFEVPESESHQRALYGDVRLPSKPGRVIARHRAKVAATLALSCTDENALALAGRANVPRIGRARPSRVHTGSPGTPRSAGAGMHTGTPPRQARPAMHGVTAGAHSTHVPVHPAVARSGEFHAAFGGRRPRRGMTASSHNGPGPLRRLPGRDRSRAAEARRPGAS